MVKVAEEIPDDTLCVSCNEKFEKDDNIEHVVNSGYVDDDSTEIQFRHKNCYNSF